MWLAAIGTLAAAAVGGAVVQMVSPGRSTPAAASTPAPVVVPAPAPVAAEAAGPVAPDKAALLVDARKTLEGFLADSSPRIRRLAAGALSRTGHEGSIAELGRLLESEASAISRLEIALALARAGDARGVDYLVAALGDQSRDVRLTSARYLAGLGDERAKVQLKGALGLTYHKLSAAAALAQLGDPDGFKLLKTVLAAPEAEPRMRAAVALGRAGDAAGLEVLTAMLADKNHALGAASALARLGDPSAVPVLTRALGVSSLCVDAAVALRRLGVEVDLVPLAAMLAAGDEVGKINAAEAVIVLLDASPPAELRVPAPQVTP